MSVVHRSSESEGGIGMLGVLLAAAMLVASVIVVILIFTQSSTTSAAPAVWYAVGAILLVLIAFVAFVPVRSSAPEIDYVAGARMQHRDTTGRFAAGSMGTLKTGEEGGTAVPEGAGSSAPGGSSSPGDKSPGV